MAKSALEFAITTSRACPNGTGYYYTRLYEAKRAPYIRPIGPHIPDLDDIPELFRNMVPLQPAERSRVAAAVLLRLCFKSRHLYPPQGPGPRLERVHTLVLAPDDFVAYGKPAAVGQVDANERAVVTYDNPYIRLPGEVVVPQVSEREAADNPIQEVIQATFDPKQTRAFVALRGLEQVVTPALLERQ